MSVSALLLFIAVCAGFVGIPYLIYRAVRKWSVPPPVEPSTDAPLTAEIEFAIASFTDRPFYPSANSQLAKARRSLWFSILTGLAIAAVLSRGSWATMAWTSAVLLAVSLFLDRMMRKRLQSGEPAVILTRHGIESTSLSGKLKVLRWQDIADVSYLSVQGNPALKFELRESAGLPNKRTFWTGANPAQPTLLMAPLSAEDQEVLLGEIRTRLSKFTAGRTAACPGPQGNEIREEREFAERLKALEPNPWMTHALIALNVGIWLWTLTAGAALLQSPADKLLQWGGNASSEVQRGEWWRLLSAMFLHSGMMHVLMNMLGLYSAGVIVERVYGRSLYLLIYLGSGLLGSATSLHFSAQHGVSVGASGAVFGITGALLVGFLQHRNELPKATSKRIVSGLGVFVLYSLIQGFGKQGIDNAAHVGGLLGGCLLAYILPKRFDLEQYRRTVFSRFATGLVLAAAMTATVALEAPPAALDISRIFASAEIMKRGFDRFGNAAKQLQRLEDDVKAGKLSEWDADERGRRIVAPQFKSVVDDLSQVVLYPDDPRRDLLRDTLRLSELMNESLAMESIRQEAEAKPKPVDPERMAQIEVEIRQVAERLKADTELLNNKRN